MSAELYTLPKYWEWGVLGDDAEIKGRIGWKGYKKEDLRDTGPIVIGGSNVKCSLFLDLSELKHLTREKYEESPEIILQKGDVLLVQRGNGIADCGYFDGSIPEATINPTMIIISNFKGDPKFLFYYLASPVGRANVLSRASGSSIPAIYQKPLKLLQYPKPPVALQKKIADYLSAIDYKIELNRKINQTLEEMAQAIFKSWFVDFEPVKAKIEAKEGGQDPERAAMCVISGKTDEELNQLPPDQLAQLRTTAALFPDELTDSELGPIPKGWEVRKIEDIIKRFPVGKKYAQKTASEKGQVPILDQGKSGIIGYHNDKPGVTASPDDPIIVFANHTCYMRLIMHDFSAIQNVLPFKGLDLDIHWVYCATYGKQQFIEYKGHWPDFIIKKVVVPNNQLDEKFGDYVGTFFKTIFQNDLQSLSLAELRDTLLPKLLSGEIDLNQVD